MPLDGNSHSSTTASEFTRESLSVSARSSAAVLVDSIEPYPLENPTCVEQWRHEMGLPSPAEITARARENPPPQPRDRASDDAREEEWRRQVGWIF
jgi:hypothetical protein